MSAKKKSRKTNIQLGQLQSWSHKIKNKENWHCSKSRMTMGIKKKGVWSSIHILHQKFQICVCVCVCGIKLKENF